MIDTYNGEYVEISKEHSEIGFAYIETLKTDNFNAFWEMVCDIDKARVYGIYYSLKNEGKFNCEFKDFVISEIFSFVKGKYEPVFENTGVATHLRFTEFGEHIVCMVPDVIAQRHYISETPVVIFPIVIVPEMKINFLDTTSSWKVRIYEDKDFE